MRGLIDQLSRFLELPLGAGPRALLLLAVLLLIPCYLFPLWNMTMFAPQYPDGLRIHIYSYKLDGGNKGQDVREVNVLNHYIGMKDLETADFTEFKWMPFVVGVLGLLLLRTAVLGKMTHLVDVFVLYVYFGLFSLWSFAYKMYAYGHNLAPTASVKVDPFMPPLFGYKKLANFEVYSYPAPGSYALGAAVVLLLAALVVGWRQGRTAAAKAPMVRSATLLFLAAFVAGASAFGQEERASTPGQLEGRPPAAQASPLQARIDATPRGGTLEVDPGTHEGDLVIDRPLRLVGRGRPRLVGSGAGSVVRVRADDVTLEGFDIDGRGGGDLGRDSSGIHVSASRATIRDCRITNALFGIYLREADGATVEGCSIRGIPGKDAGEKGSGIHAWNSEGFRFARNEITDVRDGIYIQSSSKGTIVGNVARDLRYGLHYMFSDDNTFEDNLFENGAAGTAIMYSRRIVFRRNRFLHNRGFASVGLLFKTCDDVLAEDNLIADNARGIFLEGSSRNVFRRNVLAQSDTAIVLYDSCSANRFEANSFVGNLTPLTLVGKRTDTVFAGNYFSDDDEPDLDGDGRSDRPYRLSSVFDHLRGNLTAADLFSQGFAAAALGTAERTFPVLQRVPVEDASPRARPPALAQVPAPGARRARVHGGGLLGSMAILGFGTALFLRGRRASQRRDP